MPKTKKPKKLPTTKPRKRQAPNLSSTATVNRRKPNLRIVKKPTQLQLIRHRLRNIRPSLPALEGWLLGTAAAVFLIWFFGGFSA